MAQIVLAGAGHNGLVCAFYLARAGHRVTLIEQCASVGGACRNERWESGAVVSPGANHFGMLNEKIASDMGLWRRGLAIVRADPQLIVGLSSGESLALFDDFERTSRELAHYDRRDSAALVEFFRDIASVRTVIQRHIFELEPSLASFVDELNSVREGLAGRFVSNSIKDTLCHYFRSEQAKALFSATGFLYNAAPDEPGTAFTLAYLSMFSTNGSPGWGIPRGGMGRIVDLMADAITELGVKIIVNTKAEAIEINDHSAVGVRCSDGSSFYGDYVVSNADPYTTYVKLCSQSPSLLNAWDDSKFTGPCAKFNFTFRDNVLPKNINENHLPLINRSAYVHLPTLEYAEAAFHSAVKNGYSDHVYFEFVCPSDFDPSLSPSGLHIGSAYCLFANYDVISGWDVDTRNARKQEAFRYILSQLGITGIVETEQLDPVDIERKFGMYKGNVDHGSPVLNNTFENRNIERRFGINRLVICGAGSHPGGLVSGVPGFNAAQKVLRELQ
jgi:phytoene dehydrogenase-like protein